MFKSQATKKALLVGVVALMLCLAMLTGTTFAWFTDQETSGNNKIIAGYLDVQLLMYDVTAGDYIDIGANSDPIFGDENSLIAQNKNLDTLWEPGKTQIAYLAIKNAGNLAIKYNVEVNVENLGLIGALEYAIVPMGGAATSATVLGANWADIKALSGVSTGDLAAGTTMAAENGCLDEIRNGTTDETDYFALVIHMKEDADNNYMSKDGAIKSVKIDITVNATQVDAEEDAFGDDYDEGLQPPNADGLVLESFADGSDYYRTDAGLVLYDTQDVVATDYVVPDGISVLGDYSLSNNANIKTVKTASTVTSLGRAFDSSSSIEKVVLNEGLEQIDSRAFRSTTALKEVVIPSTVKTIADNAFQKSGIKEITIPATVETIGETAFGSSKIEKVTIKGNTSIQGYAFRGCTALREVYLNGNDVEFIPSTLNGRNSTWFCNGESNNPNTSNITFHVVNETVAKRVKTAMGAEANNTPVYVNGVLYNG